jgi:O-antigen ligase
MTIFLSLRRGLSLRPAGLARLAATVLTVGVSGAILLTTDYFPSTLSQRVSRTLQAEHNLVQDRTRLAVAGWRAFRESPIIGIGLDNFRYIGDRYMPVISQQLPHNLWIQLLVHTGLFGALAFLSMLLIWFQMLSRAHRLEPDDAQRDLLWAFIASMCAILTIFLFIPVLIQRQYWWLFGIGLSAAMGRNAIRAAITDATSVPEDSR